jgi:ribosomal protein S18 acetylase RimI-like enzyme
MSDLLRIETVEPAGWPALAAFIAERNAADGDVRCLHSHAGDDAAAHADELRALGADEGHYCVARRGDTIVGVAGAEFDAALGRAWLRGPLVAAGEDFGYLAGLLLDALCSHLPPGVDRHDAFVSARCDEALRFYRDRGFGADAGHDEFTLHATPAPYAVNAGLELVLPDPAWRDAVGGLHQAEFPGGYATADALFAPPAADRFTRIALVGGSPAGYVHAHFDAQWQEGYVDFLAVAPWARGRGLGRALLQAATDWSFRPMRARAVTLTVRADREAARALYLSAGFTCVRRGIGLRRQRTA